MKSVLQMKSEFGLSQSLYVRLSMTFATELYVSILRHFFSFKQNLCDHWDHVKLFLVMCYSCKLRDIFSTWDALKGRREYFCYFPVLVWVPKLCTFITDLCLAPFAHLKSRCFFEFQNNWLIKNRFCCYFTWIVKQDVFRRSKQEKSFRVNVCKAHDTDYMNYILLNISLFYLIRFLWVYL